MRATTMIHLGIRHVGAGDQPDSYFEVSVKEAMLMIAKFMAVNSLATRMEFKVGRSRESISFDAKADQQQHLDSTFDALFSEEGVE